MRRRGLILLAALLGALSLLSIRRAMTLMRMRGTIR
jgi:hypothetical protein